MVLLLSGKELREALPMNEAICAVEEGFRLSRSAIVPRRIPISVTGNDGLFLYMPAYVSGVEALVVKEVSVHKLNPNRGLPTVRGTVILNDPKDGTLLAIMDGATLTAIRTGATTGVATKCLARGDSAVLGIFGAGVQARTQLEAVTEVRSIKLTKVFDLQRSRAEGLSVEMSKKLGIDVVPTESPKEALNGADIIVTATTSKTPVFSGEWVTEGMHINGIGSHTPDARELDTTTIKNSRLIVDSREACFEEAGDIIIPIREGAISESHIRADLGEIVRREKDGRTNDKEITVFKSVGLALEDAVAALRAYMIASEKGFGKIVDL